MSADGGVPLRISCVMGYHVVFDISREGISCQDVGPVHHLVILESRPTRGGEGGTWCGGERGTRG